MLVVIASILGSRAGKAVYALLPHTIPQMQLTHYQHLTNTVDCKHMKRDMLIKQIAQAYLTRSNLGISFR